MSIGCAISDSVWFYAEISRLGNFLPNGNIRVENFGNVTVKVCNTASNTTKTHTISYQKLLFRSIFEKNFVV